MIQSTRWFVYLMKSLKLSSVKTLTNNTKNWPQLQLNLAISWGQTAMQQKFIYLRLLLSTNSHFCYPSIHISFGTLNCLKNTLTKSISIQHFLSPSIRITTSHLSTIDDLCRGIVYYVDYNEHDISQLLNSIGEVYKKKDSSVKRMRGARLCK